MHSGATILHEGVCTASRTAQEKSSYKMAKRTSPIGPLPPGMEIGPPRPPGPQPPAPPSGNKMAKRTSLTGRFPPGMQPEKSSYEMAKRTSPIGPLTPGMVIGPPRPPGPQPPAPPSGKSSYEKMKNILQYLFA